MNPMDTKNAARKAPQARMRKRPGPADPSPGLPGYRPRHYCGGLNFVGPRLYVKFTVTHQGVTRGPFITPNAANGIPADTYTYQGKRLRYGINAQYSLAKALSIYGSIANLGGFIGGNLRYSPTTPDFMKERRRQEFPSTVQIGIKGQY